MKDFFTPRSPRSPREHNPVARYVGRSVIVGIGCRWAMLLFLILAAGPASAKLQILRHVPSTFVYPVDGHIPFNIHKGTPTLLTLMLPGASFYNPQGVACALLQSTDNPKDPLDDVELTVLGANSGAGEILYNVGLRNVRKMGVTGRGVNQFRDPVGTAIHRSGAAAVADSGNDRIVMLKHDGYRLTWIKAEGKTGDAPGQFRGPQGVAFDCAGNLYVSDTGNDRLQRRTPDGQWSVLSGADLSGPTGLAVIDGSDPWTYHTQGPYANRLAVIDRKGTRLQTLTLDASPLSSWTAGSDPGEGAVHLNACAFDYFGHLVATDDARSCLRKYDRDLTPLAVFGSFGDEDYQFRKPRGIAIHKQLGQVVVAEEQSVQYMWVGADALNLRAEPVPGGVAFRFFLTEAAQVTAEVRRADGTPVSVVAKDITLDEKTRAILWRPSPLTRKGTYWLHLQVMATYSSRDRLAKILKLEFPYDGSGTPLKPIPSPPGDSGISRPLPETLVGTPTPIPASVSPGPTWTPPVWGYGFPASSTTIPTPDAGTPSGAD